MKKIISITLTFLILFSLCACTQKEEKAPEKERFAVIAALEYEVSLIRDSLENMEETELLSTPVYKGTIGNCEVVVMQCGMGKVSAGIGTQALIDKYEPDYIINTGCAGALSPELGIGDTVLSSNVVEWDLDLRAIGYPEGYIDALGCVEMEASSELCNKIEKACPDDTKIVRGTVASGDQFVSTNEQRKFILENFPDALCAEMEGAAVGHVCVQNGVPFCIVRSMSDTADGNSGVNFAEFSEQASQKSAQWLVNMFKGQ